MSVTLPHRPPVRTRRIVLALLLQLTVGYLIPFAGLVLAGVLGVTWFRGRWALTALFLLVGIIEAYVFVSGAGWFGTRVYNFDN